MIESKLSFLDKQIKGLGTYAVEFSQPSFGKTPEAFKTVNVTFPPSKFMMRMVYSVVIIAIEN